MARPFSDTPSAVEVDLLHSLSDMGLSQRPLTERVSIVAMALLFASGLRGLQSVKTADIARLAQTTETTLFRHFKTRDEIIDASVEWSWQTLNNELVSAEFDKPTLGSPQETIERDVGAILGMFKEPLTRLAGTGALLSFRRPALSPGGVCPSQGRYERRLTYICGAYLSQQVPDLDVEDPAAQLATFLTNYLASVWFTWLPYMDRWDDAEFLLNPGYAMAGLHTHLSEASTLIAKLHSATQGS